MRSLINKCRGLNLFLSLHLLFFFNSLQFHHGHDAEDYLNTGDALYRVIVVGIHSHHCDTDFPLFANHKIIIEPKIKCLLCTFNRWHFLSSSDNPAVFILTVKDIVSRSAELISFRNASINYRLRAPPILFLSS